MSITQDQLNSVNVAFRNFLRRKFLHTTISAVARESGVSRPVLSNLHCEKSQITGTQLDTLLRLVPELLPVMMQVLNSKDVTQITESKEITKEEKIAIIKNLLDSL